MSFLRKLFTGKSKETKYKTYTNYEIKSTNTRVRIILQLHLQRLRKQIQKKKKHFIQNSSQINRNVLLQLMKVIAHWQCFNLLIQLTRKTQEASVHLQTCKLNELSDYLPYFQSILWLQNTCSIKNLDFFREFCFNYFKGVNLESQFAIRMQTYQKYPILQCIDSKQLPSPQIIFSLTTPFLRNHFDQTTFQVLLGLIRPPNYQQSHTGHYSNMNKINSHNPPKQQFLIEQKHASSMPIQPHSFIHYDEPSKHTNSGQKQAVTNYYSLQSKLQQIIEVSQLSSSSKNSINNETNNYAKIKNLKQVHTNNQYNQFFKQNINNNSLQKNNVALINIKNQNQYNESLSNKQQITKSFHKHNPYSNDQYFNLYDNNKLSDSNLPLNSSEIIKNLIQVQEKSPQKQSKQEGIRILNQQAQLQYQNASYVNQSQIKMQPRSNISVNQMIFSETCSVDCESQQSMSRKLSNDQGNSLQNKQSLMDAPLQISLMESVTVPFLITNYQQEQSQEKQQIDTRQIQINQEDYDTYMHQRDIQQSIQIIRKVLKEQKLEKIKGYMVKLPGMGH